jgi:hypothetical protein
MKTFFKKATINWGCYNNHGQRKQDTIWFTESLIISDILNADIPLKDKVWFIRRNCEFTTDEFRQFAIGCALCVLPIYEAKYPGDNKPREAVQAAKDYLAGVIGIGVLFEKRSAAYAAYVAAAVDNAAHTAVAAAAYTSVAAAYVAAYAAAAAAAYTAAAAADAYTAAAYAAYVAAAAVDNAAADAYTAAAAADAAADADATADAYVRNDKVNYQKLLLQFFKDFTTQKETV